MTNQCRFSLLTSVLFLAATPAAWSGVTFDFDYSDSSAATHWPAAARTALANAGERMAAYLTSYSGNVTIRVTGYNDPLGGFASALPNFDVPSALPGFSTIGVAGTKILSNGATDLNGAEADGWIDANMGDWYSYGDTVDPAEWDFTGLMMHELAHTLGFFSLIMADGSTYLPNVFAPMEQHMTTKDGTHLVTSAGSGLYEVNTSLWDTASVGGPANGVYFSGPNAMAANGGNPVALYSPADFLHTISLNHPDPSVAANLMNTFFPAGLTARTFSDIEIGMFRDLGYSGFAVPEPGVTVLTFAGLALTLSRRRKAQERKS